jgi:type I restriction enzyme, S subunit
LKKAFEGKLSGLGFVGLKDDRITEKSDKNDILKSSNPKNPNSDSEFPKKIESITPIELQAGIISMVIDAHTKNPKYVNKFNHVKCEKISDLVERKLGISLGRNAVKDAAGPDDYSHLKKVEHRATMAGYFQVVPQSIGHAYKPMRNLQKAIDKAKEVLSEHDLNSVNELIKQFLPFELEHAELVATIYAGWNNLLLLGKDPTDEEIIYESRENWSKRKLTINRQRFFDALKWMRDHNYIPEGKGKPVLKSEEVNMGKDKKSKND